MHIEKIQAYGKELYKAEFSIKNEGYVKEGDTFTIGNLSFICDKLPSFAVEEEIICKGYDQKDVYIKDYHQEEKDFVLESYNVGETKGRVIVAQGLTATQVSNLAIHFGYETFHAWECSIKELVEAEEKPKATRKKRKAE